MRVLLLLLSLFMALSLHAQSVDVSVDVNADNVVISPYIYGLNYDVEEEYPAFLKSVRIGGNRWSGYNWENNASNAGKDLNHSSDYYLVGGYNSGLPPAYAVTNTVAELKKNRQFALATLPLAGFVAADANGPVSLDEAAPSSRWDSVIVRKNESLSVEPDLTDGVVYMDEFVNYLKLQLGNAKDEGINAYNLGNEPDYWRGTHPRIRNGIGATYGEVISKAIEYGKMVKDMDPDALVIGPSVASWANLRNLNSASDYYLYFDRYDWFVDAYLDSLAQASAEYGKPILDVFNFNYYPETQGNSSRIIWNNSQLVDTLPDVCIARLQAPRSMWDITYIEKNPFNGGTPMNILPKLRKSVDAYFPGTKLAITEFEYGAEYHITGGLVLVDLLGVWGREELFLATKWHGFQKYSEMAYKLYLDYDGNGASYGETAVKAANTNDSLVSTFASLDEKGYLHLIVVNKAETETNLTYQINNSFFKNASVWGFERGSNSVEQYDSVKQFTNYNQFNYALPARSALHFVCEPENVISIERAYVKMDDGSKVVVELSMDISSNTIVSNLADGIKIEIGGAEAIITSISSLSSSVIEITLQEVIPIEESDITISIDAQQISGINELSMNMITNHPVYNLLAGAEPQIISAYTSNDGKELVLIFSKTMNAVGNEYQNIILQVNEDTIQFLNSNQNVDTLFLECSKRIISDDELSISYSGIGLEDVDGGKILSFTNVPVLNFGPAQSPEIDTVSIEIYGHRAKLNFTRYIESENIVDAGILVYENDTLKHFDILQMNRSIQFSFKYPVSYGSNVRIVYDGLYPIKSLEGGFLDSFDYSFVYEPDNVISEISVPGIIESDEIYYANSGDLLFEQSAGIEFVTGLKDGNTLTYNINVSEAGDYVLNFYTAGSGYGQIDIICAGAVYSGLYIPPTGSVTSWQKSGVALYLEKGVQNIQINIPKAGFAFDKIEIGQNLNIPEVTYLKGEVAASGSEVILSFNRYWGTSPDVSEISITAGGKIIPVSQVKTENYKLILTLDELISKGQEVLLSMPSSDAISKEGGTFLGFSDKVLWNRSSFSTSIDEIESNVIFAPNPLESETLMITSNLYKINKLIISDLTGKIIYNNNIIPDFNVLFCKSDILYVSEYYVCTVILENGDIFYQKLFIK